MKPQVNLLNLQHDLFSIKGASFLGFEFVGSFSFYSFAKEFILDKVIVLILSMIWFTLFGIIAINQFKECYIIQNKIKEDIKKNFH